MPIAIDFKLNIEPTETDQPKMIKKKVLITKADSPVTTLKSERILSTLSSSINFDNPPIKNTRWLFSIIPKIKIIINDDR